MVLQCGAGAGALAVCWRVCRGMTRCCAELGCVRHVIDSHSNCLSGSAFVCALSTNSLNVAELTFLDLDVWSDDRSCMCAGRYCLWVQ
jgi:hypothetical protein